MPNTTLPSPDRLVVLLGLGLLLGLVGCSRPLLTPPAEPDFVAPSPAPARPRADLERDVRNLAADDFVVRARAAERLVAAGPEALRALGQAGDQPVLLYGRESVATTRPVIDAILADLPDEAVRHQLSQAEPVVRRAAADALGERDRWRSVVALIDATEDEAVSVRAAAVAALRRLTNQFFGFQAEAPVTLRAAATEKWRSWWAIEGRVEAEERDEDEG